MADLSVIIPTYKRTDSIVRLVKLLLQQQGAQIEVLVIDQNPPGYFSAEAMQLFNQVKYLHQSSPNASSARNFGFGHASAKYILFLDDDLVPDELFCKKGIEILNNCPEAGSFVPLVYSVNEDKPAALSNLKRKSLKNEQCGGFQITDSISAAVFFRREYFEKTGGFDPHLFEYARTAEDQELFIRMNRRKLSLWCMPQLEIFHDEGVAGGCELRTEDYWKTRERCVRSWVFRHRAHSNNFGKLSFSDLIRLCRSSFLNSDIFRRSPSETLRQIKILRLALQDSRNKIEEVGKYYDSIQSSNHLSFYS